MKDKELRSQDCCTHFLFTVAQQKRYAEKGRPDPLPELPGAKERELAHERGI